MELTNLKEDKKQLKRKPKIGDCLELSLKSNSQKYQEKSPSKTGGATNSNNSTGFSTEMATERHSSRSSSEEEENLRKGFIYVDISSVVGDRPTPTHHCYCKHPEIPKKVLQCRGMCVIRHLRKRYNDKFANDPSMLIERKPYHSSSSRKKLSSLRESSVTKPKWMYTIEVYKGELDPSVFKNVLFFNSTTTLPGERDAPRYMTNLEMKSGPKLEILNDKRPNQIKELMSLLLEHGGALSKLVNTMLERWLRMGTRFLIRNYEEVLIPEKYPTPQGLKQIQRLPFESFSEYKHDYNISLAGPTKKLYQNNEPPKQYYTHIAGCCTCETCHCETTKSVRPMVHTTIFDKVRKPYQVEGSLPKLHRRFDCETRIKLERTFLKLCDITDTEESDSSCCDCYLYDALKEDSPNLNKVQEKVVIVTDNSELSNGAPKKSKSMSFTEQETSSTRSLAEDEIDHSISTRPPATEEVTISSNIHSTTDKSSAGSKKPLANLEKVKKRRKKKTKEEIMEEELGGIWKKVWLHFYNQRILTQFEVEYIMMQKDILNKKRELLAKQKEKENKQARKDNLAFLRKVMDLPVEELLSKNTIRIMEHKRHKQKQKGRYESIVFRGIVPDYDTTIHAQIAKNSKFIGDSKWKNANPAPKINLPKNLKKAKALRKAAEKARNKYNNILFCNRFRDFVMAANEGRRKGQPPVFPDIRELCGISSTESSSSEDKSKFSGTEKLNQKKQTSEWRKKTEKQTESYNTDDLNKISVIITDDLEQKNTTTKSSVLEKKTAQPTIRKLNKKRRPYRLGNLKDSSECCCKECQNCPRRKSGKIMSELSSKSNEKTDDSHTSEYNTAICPICPEEIRNAIITSNSDIIKTNTVETTSKFNHQQIKRRKMQDTLKNENSNQNAVPLMHPKCLQCGLLRPEKMMRLCENDHNIHMGCLDTWLQTVPPNIVCNACQDTCKNLKNQYYQEENKQDNEKLDKEENMRNIKETIF